MTTGVDPGWSSFNDWQLKNDTTDTLPSLEESEDDAALQSWKLGLQVTSLLVICALSVVGNFLVFFSLLKKEQLRIPSNRLVFSLTVSNFILSILVFPFIVVSCVFGDWMFGIFWCNFTAFLTVLVTSASALNIGVIAIDRYYAIVRPLLYTITITNSRSTLLLLTVWLLAFACALPPLFGWSKFHYQSIEGACFVDWSDHVGYTAFVLSTSVLLPFVTMVVCYYFIFQVVRTKCRKIHVGTMGVGGDAGSSLESPQRRVVVRHSSSWRFSLPRKPSWLLTTYSSPVKGLRTICFVLGVFMMTTFPFLVTSLAEASEMSDWFPWWFNTFSLWLLFTSSATYPIVYGLFNRSIRKHLKCCAFPFSFCKWRSSTTVGRPSSRRVSVSISLLDFSPFKPFRTLNNSRRSSTLSFDGNRVVFTCNSRKGSQDSGAVMTESEGENESTHFAPHRNRRRLSAPSRLQVMSTIYSQSNSSTNALKMTQTLNPDTTEARCSLVNLAMRRNVFCRHLEHAAQKRTRNSVAVIDIPSGYATASTSLATSTSPNEDLFDGSLDEGIDNDVHLKETTISFGVNCT